MFPRGVQYSPNPIVEKAQLLCVQFNYSECEAFIEQNLDKVEGEDQGELYLIRAQIKMFCCDEAILDDLKSAKKHLPGPSRLTMIETSHIPDATCLFAVFNTQPGSVSSFKFVLQKSIPLLRKLCGKAGSELPLALEAEILYHTGYIEKAIEQAVPIYERMVAASNYYYAMVLGFVLIRCYVAQGNLEKMNQVNSQLEKYSRILSKPRLKDVYTGMQGWIGCTTGWMGQYPRFLHSPNGIEHSVLDNRIEVMLGGISTLGNMEDAVFRAARRSMPGAVSMKSLYASLYEALILFKLGKKDQAALIFYQQYIATHKNRIIMPFAEYGDQILPLLQYAVSRPDGNRFARRWSDKLNQMATQYEESLCVIRGEHRTASIIEAEFTELEMDILRGLTNKLTIAQTADSVHISVLDIKEQIRDIYRKLDVHNRSEAVAKAIGAHIIIPIK